MAELELEWIAWSKVVFIEKDGVRHRGSIRIAMPEHLESYAACYFILDPIMPERRTLGDDPLKALMLAIRTCATELALFEQRGGRIVYPDDDDTGEPDFRWDPSVAFGALFRLPDGATKT